MMSNKEDYTNPTYFRDPEGDQKSFENLIRLAEEVRLKYENLRQKMIVIVFSTLTAGFIFGFGSYRLSEMTGRGGFWELYFLPGLIVVASTAFSIFVALEYRRQMTREKYALRQIVDMVVEIFQSHRESMSAIQAAEFKIRISRIEL